MRFARDFNGFLVDAEINRRHGNFICPVCHNLAHWRRISVDQRCPHFYHAKANEDCPLSAIGGKWNILEDENVEYSSELEGEPFFFQRKTVPNLSKIPSEFINDTETEIQISPADMKIRLKSSDVSQLDHTVSSFCNFMKNQKTGYILVIPLPTWISKVRGKESSTQRIHRRLVKIIDSTPNLVNKLAVLNIPENVDIEFGTHN